MRLVRRPNDLGYALQHYRKKAGLSQSDVAKKHNLNQVMISRLETGQSSQSVSRLFDILATLDLEMVIQPRSDSSVDDVAKMFL